MDGSIKPDLARLFLSASLGLSLILSIALSSAAIRATAAAEAPSHSLAQTAPSTAKPPLMLANVYRPGVDLGDYWVSEKLDGVRAYWDGTRLISRGGHLIHAPDWFIAGFPPIPLDGELWMGRGRFERLSGTVRRQEPDPEAWREVRFMAFDLPAMAAPFGVRLVELRRRLAESPSAVIVLVEQTRVTDHAALMERLDALVAAGGEGLMLHRDSSLYRAGRSDDLLKVKPHFDAEARVIAHLPGKGKYEGMLGALLVEDAEGRRFRLGTGFSDADRRSPPPIGSLVTFSYRDRTEAGIPRFASFLRVRKGE